ncbi:MAG: hypothetical protein ABWY06_03490 [Pseudomonas sp.]|uniref:hypothetical protein n=1 Tax=Pseudomonas sp. TaxID=306 RepID=UPI0033976050
MDPYQTPETDLQTTTTRPFKPISGLLLGLCIYLILGQLLSVVLTYGYGLALGLDITNVTFMTALAGHPFYLALDLVLSSALLFYAGRVIGKRTPGQELRYAAVLTAILLVLNLLMFYYTDTFSVYPVWYSTLIILITLTMIPLGARNSAPRP